MDEEEYTSCRDNPWDSGDPLRVAVVEEAQSVGNHDEGAAFVGDDGDADAGTGDGERDEDTDDAEAEVQVLFDGAAGSAGEADSGGQAGEAIGEQGDVGGLEGDIAAGGAHGHPDIGGCQRGGVVDAIADHCDAVGRCECVDGVHLVGGQEAAVGGGLFVWQVLRILATSVRFLR